MTPKAKILSIDDDAANNKLIGFSLREHFDIICVSSGHEGLNTLNAEPVDAILLDVNMPDIDGYEVCQRLRENSAFDNIPVLFVSGYDSEEQRLKGYSAGGDDYICKPFSPIELQRKLELLLAIKKQNENLKTELNDATSAVMTALTQTSEMGCVLEFMKQSFLCIHYAELGQAILAAFKTLGLSCYLQIRWGYTISRSLDKGRYDQTT